MFYMQNPVTRLYSAVYMCEMCDDEYFHGNDEITRRVLCQYIFGENNYLHSIAADHI